MVAVVAVDVDLLFVIHCPLRSIIPANTCVREASL